MTVASNGQVADKNPPPADGKTISIRTDGHTGAPPREVARLEDVLTVAPSDNHSRIAPRTAAAAVPELEPAQTEADDVATEATPERVESVPPPEPVQSVAPPTSTPEPASQPRYVAAHQLRAAFWFEQTSAFESHDDDVAARLVHLAAAPEVEAEPLEADTAAGAFGQTSQSHWLAALCLLAVIALVLALTGRRPRGCTGEATR